MKFLSVILFGTAFTSQAFAAATFYNCSTISGPDVSGNIHIRGKGHTVVHGNPYYLASGWIYEDRLVLKFYPSDRRIGVPGTLYASCDTE